MSDNEETQSNSTSMPPGTVDALSLLQTMLPVVVQSATDSAKSSTAAAAAMTSLEDKLGQLQASVDQNTAAVNRFAAAKEHENKLRKESNLNAENKNKRWHETARSIFTPQVVIQILTVLGVGLGIWTQLPAPSAVPATMDEGAPPVTRPVPVQHPGE
jgi:hypothetical protein